MLLRQLPGRSLSTQPAAAPPAGILATGAPTGRDPVRRRCQLLGFQTPAPRCLGTSRTTARLLRFHRALLRRPRSRRGLFLAGGSLHDKIVPFGNPAAGSTPAGIPTGGVCGGQDPDGRLISVPVLVLVCHAARSRSWWALRGVCTRLSHGHLFAFTPEGFSFLYTILHNITQ